MGNTDNKENQDVTWSKYSEFSNRVFDVMIKEQQILLTSLHEGQITVIRHYLWIGAAIVAANWGMLSVENLSLRNINGLAVIFCPALLVSCGLALFALIKSVSALLGERDGNLPCFTDSYILRLHEGYGSDSSSKPVDALTSWEEHIDKSIELLRELHSEKGEKIRSINSTLCLSGWLSSIGAFFWIMEKLLE